MSLFAPAPLDLQSLRCFLAAAKSKSFRAAAKRVALSPAAFSDRIQRLEEELGERLFLRTTRSLQLSPAGERLVPRAQACLEAARECVDAVRDEEQAAPYDLTIGTRYELGMSFVLPAIADLERERPWRRLHMTFGNTPELLRQARSGTIDAFISSARLTQGQLAFASLHEEKYVFVAAPALLKRRPLRRPGDAAEHTLLETARDLPLFRYFLDVRPPTEVWSFGHTQILGGIGPMRERALSGAGVCVLPLYFVAQDLKTKRLSALFEAQKLAPDWFRLVWPKGHPRDAELRELASELAARPLK